jgi:hypothetical protein
MDTNIFIEILGKIEKLLYTVNIVETHHVKLMKGVQKILTIFVLKCVVINK